MAKSIMEQKNWLLLAGAVVLASLAFWLTHSYLKDQELRLAESLRTAPPKTQRVVVANRPVTPGEVIGPETMSLAEFPVSAVSPAAITPQNYHEVENHMIKYPMAAGEPLLTHHVDRLVISRFSQLLDEGERAISFDIDNLDSISGMLMPGDYIDILVEYDEPKNSSGETEIKIKPLIQRVRVLAVDEFPLRARDQANIHYGSHSLKYGSVTVAAPYRDAIALTVAKHSHNIRFLLRNEDDKRIVASSALGGYELVSGKHGKNNPGLYLYYSNKTHGKGSFKSSAIEVSAHTRNGASHSIIRQQLKPMDKYGLNNGR